MIFTPPPPRAHRVDLSAAAEETGPYGGRRYCHYCGARLSASPFVGRHNRLLCKQCGDDEKLFMAKYTDQAQQEPDAQ